MSRCGVLFLSFKTNEMRDIMPRKNLEIHLLLLPSQSSLCVLKYRPQITE